MLLCHAPALTNLLRIPHRHHALLATLLSDPSRTCIHTSKDSPYSTFTGDSAYYSQTVDYATYYSTSGPTPLPWSNSDPCSAANLGLCEVPVAVFTCPAPPPAPPAAPIPPACVPANNASHYCTATACYVLNATADTYANHKAACQAMGGAWPVAFNNASQQQEVEGALAISDFYWLGVEEGPNYQWVLADGSGSAGNGQPSNASPYAHW